MRWYEGIGIKFGIIRSSMFVGFFAVFLFQ